MNGNDRICQKIKRKKKYTKLIIRYYTKYPQKEMCFTLSYKNIKKLCENSIYSCNRFGSVRIEGGSRHSLERSHDSRDMLDFERRNRSMHDLQGVLPVLQDSRPWCSGRLGPRRLRYMQLHSRGWKSELRNLLLESKSLHYA